MRKLAIWYMLQACAFDHHFRPILCGASIELFGFEHNKNTGMWQPGLSGRPGTRQATWISSKVLFLVFWGYITATPIWERPINELCLTPIRNMADGPCYVEAMGHGMSRGSVREPRICNGDRHLESPIPERPKPAAKFVFGSESPGFSWDQTLETPLLCSCPHAFRPCGTGQLKNRGLLC